MPYSFARLLNRLSFRQLQVFRTVCQQLSYSRAAEQLGLTQPAVSAQIRQLEQALGQPVFEYVGKQLYITPAGERLEQVTGTIFADLERLQMELAQMEGQVRGELRLAAVSTAQYVVPYLLRGFLRQFPHIDVRVEIVNRARAIQRLTENRDDLVIMGMPPESKSLSCMPFLDNVMIPVVRADDPLRQQQPVAAHTFLEAGLLLREPGSGTRKALEQWCHKQRLSLTPRMELGSNAAIKHGVLAGLGVAVLPLLSVRAELSMGELAALELDGFPLRRSWCAVHPAAKQPTPVMQAFLGYIRQTMRDLERQVYGHDRQPGRPRTDDEAQ